MRSSTLYFSTSLEHLPISSLTTPFVFDFTQTGNDDILYQDFADSTFKLFRANTTFPDILSIAAGQFTTATSCELIAQTEKHPNRTIVTIFGYHNSSWLPVQTFATPPHSGALAVGDFDGDGLLDIVFPVGASSLCFMFNVGHGFYTDLTCGNSSIAMMHPMTDTIVADARPEVGDLRLTGFPDVAIAVHRDGKTVMEVLLNKHCVMCESRPIEFIGSAHLDGTGAFFDLHDDGKLDLVTDRGAYISTLPADSACFLRVTALNGRFHDDRYPATVASGATVRVQFTDIVGNRHQRVAVQQAALPYVTVGLGETVHYVEAIGVWATGGADTSRLLPNSKVYASVGHQKRVYLLWVVRPFWVFFGTTCLILGLGFVVLWFSRREEDEDKKEAEEMLPLF
jgi:hypothetical protein